MLRKTTIIAAALAVLAVTSCSRKGENPRYRLGKSAMPETVAGMKMNKVEASSFTFNAAYTGRPVENSHGTVQVLQGSFWISEKPVDMVLWKTIMGKASVFSFDDIEKFLDKLYKKTHVPFIVPSESMLEAALWQGKVDVQHPVFVSDDWTDSVSPAELASNWRYTEKANNFKTVRTRTERLNTERFRRSGKYLFHLAVLSTEPVPEELRKAFTLTEPARPAAAVVLEKKAYEVNGVSFTMLPVEGGQAIVGGTKEQAKYAEGDENPVLEMSFRDFLIGETEVTAGLWQAVMGYLPTWNDKNHLDRPVVGVSWYDTKEFIQKLNAITGEQFRLPGEYEWEYAARGGKRSRGYVLAGGNPPAEIGVFSNEKKNAQLSPVKTMKPNELGIYDMSGNAWEWVQGTYSEGMGVLRGGSCASRSAACRVSNRQAMAPGQIKDTFGFRLAI